METIIPSTKIISFNGERYPIRYYDFADERRVMRADVYKVAGYASNSHCPGIETIDQSKVEKRIVAHYNLAAAFWTAENVRRFAEYNVKSRGSRRRREAAGRAILEQVFNEGIKPLQPYKNLFGEEIIEPHKTVRRRVRSREIKFRGQTHGGETIYGYYNREGSYVGIILANQLEMEVKPESVSQLIGVDAKGAEVYEGDTITDGKETYRATFSHYNGIWNGGLVHV